MQSLKRLIEEHEDWLITRVVDYAKALGYAEYTSTLKEAWRASICGLSGPMIAAIELYDEPPEIIAGDDFNRHPITAFGIEQARHHRARGITLAQFLGLTKYYHQSYADLVDEMGDSLNDRKKARLFVDRFFDLVEIGFCSEWRSVPENAKLLEVQNENRQITNEKNKYLTIFESLNDPVVLLDSSYKIQNMNLAAQTLFVGWSEPGAIYYSSGQSARLESQLDSLIPYAKSKTNFQSVLQTNEGARHFDVRIQDMLDISEKFLGTVMIFNDISEHKRAREAAEEANRAKSDFLATMSHEIRTPLNGILGLARLLADTETSERQKNYINGIRSSSEVLRSVINDILDYRKIEAGVLEVEVMDFELSSIVKRVTDAVDATVINKALDFSVQIDDQLPHALRSDPTKICQILLNLVGNAVKFTEEGRVDVRIGHEEISDATGEKRTNAVRFEVRDTGIGIGETDKALLFEPFTQAGNAHSKFLFGGTGLGLAICRKLTASMGGTIDCEALTEGGSLFWFTVPYDHVFDADASNKRKRIDAAALSGLRILLVEDNPVNRMVTEGYLDNLSHTCTSVTNGREALELLERQSFDLVLMDDRMPVLTGLEALTRLRAHPDASRANTPVIIHSACITKDEVDRAFTHGADGFLSKPFTPDDLAHAIVDCMAAELQSARPKEPDTLEEAPEVPPDIIDEAQLRQHLNALGEDRTKRIVDAYLTSSTHLIDQIRVATGKDDFDELRHAAHSLKGACGNVGLSYLADLAFDLEKASEYRNEDRAQFLAQKICHIGKDASQKLLDSWQTMIETA
ncbi:Hpt sensor hybrid histidine kinase [Cohaesibacter sp. ES.047]|uniref:ATP-binding protein n=1 Tax=Cohaesibacter sp. ES.047 TaxID=1798205 RepID=UPI000BB98157|nr:ATP-binding protein [Cohaesibacter sp. ES.047]SNY93261.1 Hpt sensor hybrid histidine kinase [Cohaesibacter sp. ES.047]